MKHFRDIIVVSACVGLAPPAPGQLLMPVTPPEQRPLFDAPLAGWGPDFTNWVEVSVGGVFVDGSKAAFQQQQQVPAGAFGGVESSHFEQPVGTNRLVQVDGRGIFDNHDYELKLQLTQEQLGYIQAGYREYRTWYDRNGGFFPPTASWFTPYNREAAIDRGDAWIEAGLRMPDLPQLTLRYEHQFRSGDKDSSSWGDVTLGRGVTRAIIPSFYGIDEKRDIFQLEVKHTISATELAGGVRYERLTQENQKFMLRQPGAAVGQAAVTQDDSEDLDVFNAHGSAATRINEQLLFTTGYAFTMMDNDPSGTRIYGSGFDAVYDPNFRGAQHYEGFLNLDGSATLREHIASMNLLYTPYEHIAILPSVRIDARDESAVSTYSTTDFTAAGVATTPEETVGNNNRDYLDLAEAIELRYTGFTNWLFYARGEWSEDSGDLHQSELVLATGDQDLLDEDADRFTQKYSLGANWYPLYRLSLGGQYYYKARDYDFDNRLGPSPDYPGFIQKQNFNTHDANFRITLRPLSTVTAVTRYDYQFSTIKTAGDSLAEIQSATVNTHIISESVSWTPLSRLLLQVGFNYVLDNTYTPAVGLTDGLYRQILRSDNNYWDVNTLVGYALDDKTDLQVQYFFYQADDYQNNSQYSLPYGAGAEENGVTVTLFRQLTRSLRGSLKYGFFSNHDRLYGGHRDYTAHLVYSTLQYRF